MRFLSLNIRHGGSSRIDGIAAYVAQTAPDIAIFPEFRSGPSGSRLQGELRALGYVHQFAPEVGSITNSVLVASKLKAAPFAVTPPHVDRGRVIGCQVEDVQLLGVYFANRRAKQTLFDYLLGLPDEASNMLLIGDFNTGVHRMDEGGATFLCAAQFQQLAGRFTDVWRYQNGPHAREWSWISRVGNGFRIDHALASPSLVSRVQSCSFDHTTRPILTDHSALWLEMDL